MKPRIRIVNGNWFIPVNTTAIIATGFLFYKGLLWEMTFHDMKTLKYKKSCFRLKV